MKRLFSLLCAGWALAAGAALAQQPAPVKLSEDARTWTMDNGIVRAQVAKESGDLVSMKYKSLEMLASFLNEEGTADLAKEHFDFFPFPFGKPEVVAGVLGFRLPGEFLIAGRVHSVRGGRWSASILSDLGIPPR